MRLFDAILLSLTIGVFVIGVHQAFKHGIANSYWIFMFCVALLLFYKLRKNASGETDSNQKGVKKND